MTTTLPTTIPAYLEQLRRSLAGADPALIQDALYDAEEYLRSELAEHPDRTEADVIAAVAASYGAPDEVADIYRDTESRVQTALQLPPRRPSPSLLGKVFGVFVDPHAYGALFYMLLTLGTGIFYFTWVVTGFSLSLGLAVTLIGIPLFVLFIASVRVLALVEGRLVETMLGERMPRRPVHAGPQRTWLERIGDMLTDARTWLTSGYFLLMLPLGTLYFSFTVTALSVAVATVAFPVLKWVGIESLGTWGPVQLDVFGHDLLATHAGGVLSIVIGLALLIAVLHLARLIGRMHGRLAKHLLVTSAM